MSELIGMKNNRLMVPEHPEIPYLQGDGIGPEIWQAAQPVLDAAVRRAYQGRCEIDWLPLLAGERAHELVGEWLPQQTIMELKRHLVAIKGPMTTPVGTGHHSINVALRQTLDLYACWRPVRYFKVNIQSGFVWMFFVKTRKIFMQVLKLQPNHQLPSL